MCRRMLIFWAMDVTRRRSLQESMALQRWSQLSKERQKFSEQKWVFELTTPGEAAWGGSPRGREKSQGLKENPGSLRFQRGQQELFFCTFWSNTSFIWEINKFGVFIPVREENLKDVFNFQQTGNLIPYAMRLLIRYKPSSCFVF